jgi:hypothetical protein
MTHSIFKNNCYLFVNLLFFKSQLNNDCAIQLLILDSKQSDHQNLCLPIIYDPMLVKCWWMFHMQYHYMAHSLACFVIRRCRTCYTVNMQRTHNGTWIMWFICTFIIYGCLKFSVPVLLFLSRYRSSWDKKTPQSKYICWLSLPYIIEYRNITRFLKVRISENTSRMSI